ncbi:MAG: hypothetical protein HY902_14585 [Deltaproteobacteria bacterium]|nr:hypothetical protein [Deltaproteobacteria bacterium]
MQFQTIRRFALVIAGAASLLGCQSVLNDAAKAIDGTPLALKEPELPNTSKMLNCCTNLMGKTLTKGLVTDLCTPMSPQVTKVIDTYQAAKKQINDNTSLSAQSKTEGLAELKTKTQGSLEPAARCLLTETIGKLGPNAIPKDCEADTTIGALPQGKTCEDVKGAITQAQ